MNFFKNKTVAVLGGGGSIGSALCIQLAPYVKELRIVSLTELSLYNICQKLKDYPCNVVPILGSICDRRIVHAATHKVDLIINAAAYKHVPLCEENKLEAIKNNIVGAWMVIGYAEILRIPLIHISTDKAVNPTSTMGKTKRAAEIFALTGHTAVVRFGNVLHSSGSVLPLWQKQAANGGPVTVTDKRCTRFFMSLEEACELVLWTAANYVPGLYVFDMGEQKSIWTMAQEIATAYGVNVIETGLRPGEKLTEELFTGERTATLHPKIFRVEEPKRIYEFAIMIDALDTNNELDVLIELDLLIKGN